MKLRHPLPSALLLALGLLAPTLASAHPPAGAFDLLGLYAENMASTAVRACEARDPAGAKASAELLRQWRARDRALLAQAVEVADELEREALRRTVEGRSTDQRKAALEVLGEVQASKLASEQLALRQMALASDAQAREACSIQLEKLQTPGWTGELVQTGLARAQALRKTLAK